LKHSELVSLKAARDINSKYHSFGINSPALGAADKPIQSDAKLENKIEVVSDLSKFLDGAGDRIARGLVCTSERKNGKPDLFSSDRLASSDDILYYNIDMELVAHLLNYRRFFLDDESILPWSFGVGLPDDEKRGVGDAL